MTRPKTGRGAHLFYVGGEPRPNSASGERLGASAAFCGAVICETSNLKYERTAAVEVADARLASFESIFAPRGPKPAAVRETSSNLTRWRWHMPALKADEERRLIIRYQAGDTEAGNELAKRFHRSVVKAVARYRGLIREGISEDDLVAAGNEALVRALREYDTRRNSRLASFAKPLIEYGIRACVREWRRRGQAGATRADRYLYSHRDATAEQVVRAVYPNLRDDDKSWREKLLEAEAAIGRLKAYWPGHDQYRDEPAADDGDAAPSSPRDVLRSRIADTIDGLADDADRRAVRRLREIGRRQYALELVERDHARKASRFTHYGAPSLVQRGEPRLARYSPEWWLWQRISLAAWHAAVRANVWPKEDRRGKSPAPPRNRPRKETIRVWHLEHEPLLAAE